jgi:hypothetical protein
MSKRHTYRLKSMKGLAILSYWFWCVVCHFIIYSKLSFLKEKIASLPKFSDFLFLSWILSNGLFKLHWRYLNTDLQ